MNRITFPSHAYLLLLLLSGISSIEDDDFEAMMNLDTTYWIDPYDMMRPDPDIRAVQHVKEPIKRKILKEERICEKDSFIKEKSSAVETVQQFQKDEVHHQKYSSTNWKNCVDETPIVRRLVLILIRQLGLENMEIQSDDEVRYINLVAKVTRNDMKLLQKFSTSHEGNIHDISDAVIQIFSTFGLQEECSWDNITAYFNKFEIWVTLCVISLVFLFWLMIRQVYLWKLVTVVMLLLFFLSILWHWIHMYKLALARKQTEVLKYTDVPIECNPNKMSWGLYIWNWFSHGEDNCIKYFEALTVDPFWEVTPTRAVAETFTKFVLHPFEHLGSAVGQFFDKLLGSVSFTWRLPVLLIVSFLMIAILVMMCDYRLRAPFWLGSLEPAQKIDGKQTLKKLSNDISTMKDEVQKLQHNINTVREQSSKPALTYCKNQQLWNKVHEVNPDDQKENKKGPGGDPVGYSRRKESHSSKRKGSHKPSSGVFGLHTGTYPSQGLENKEHRTQTSKSEKETMTLSVTSTVGGDEGEVKVGCVVQENKSQLNTDNKELQSSSLKNELSKMRSKHEEATKNLYAGRISKNVASENIDKNTPSATKMEKTQNCFLPHEHPLLYEKDGNRAHQNHKSSSSVLNSTEKSVGNSCGSDDSELMFEALMSPVSSKASELLHPERPEEKICTNENYSDNTKNDNPFLERIALVLSEKELKENET